MPIYEEKLVSPFALRFTQEHIRTTFRDGRFIEAAIDEIVTAPGVGGYDVILKAPFPNIEILRWCMPRQDADLAAETNCPVGVRPREHWFTLDNRRLYCLQRAAVAAWPARCAAVVAIMYADPGTVRKKYDSSSAGFSVSIGHSYDDIPIMRWDWRERVLPLEVGAVTEPHGVLGAVIADDRKRTVDALLDASRIGSQAGHVDGGATDEAMAGMPMSRVCVGGSTSSTATPKADARPRSSSSGSEAGSDGGAARRRKGSAAAAATDERQHPAELDNYDPVVANAIREIKDQLNARGADGVVRLPHWADRYGPILGPMRAFIQSRPDKLTVVPGEGDEFTVVKARKRKGAGPGAADPQSPGGANDDLVQNALAEIEEQLNQPRHDGRVSLQDWRERYEAELGSLKSFLKLYPDKFTVIAGEGRHFRVVKTSDGPAMRAIREIEDLLKHPECDGRIEVTRWRERFEEELGAFYDFLLTRPDRFVVLPGRGADDFRVVRTRDHLAARALEELDHQVGDASFDGNVRMPHWDEVYSEALGTLKGFLESRPDRFIVSAGDPLDDRSFTVEKCGDDIADRALKEVEEQMSSPMHDGKLRVSRWNERYRESLGTLRQFLERYPDKFHIIPGENSKFMVTRRSDLKAIQALRAIECLVDAANYSGFLEVPDWESRFAPTLGELRMLLESHKDLFEVSFESNGRLAVERTEEGQEWEAIAEIEEQLALVGNSGHVRIARWTEHYSQRLGSFRRFVEAWPGRFTVIPEPGNKFSVAKVPDDIVARACAEVAEEMAHPGYDGLLKLTSWSERYLPFLGTLRKFIQSRPSRFKTYNFGNVMYTFPATPSSSSSFSRRPRRTGVASSSSAAGPGVAATFAPRPVYSGAAIPGAVASGTAANAAATAASARMYGNSAAARLFGNAAAAAASSTATASFAASQPSASATVEYVGPAEWSSAAGTSDRGGFGGFGGSGGAGGRGKGAAANGRKYQPGPVGAGAVGAGPGSVGAHAASWSQQGDHRGGAGGGGPRSAKGSGRQREDWQQTPGGGGGHRGSSRPWPSMVQPIGAHPGDVPPGANARQWM